MNVYLIFDDIDRHGAGCDCGLCDANGKSYGVAVRHWEPGVDIAMEDGEVELREYAASEESAFQNARLVCEKEGWQIVEPEEIPE